MPHKQLLFRSEAREKIRGVLLLTEATMTEVQEPKQEAPPASMEAA
jgi:hypothetical protein